MKIIISEFFENRAKAFAQWLPGAQVVRRYAGEKLPSSFDMLIMGGGPMGATSEYREKYPYLQEEFRLIQEASVLDKGAPYLVGICLGAQLITIALGGEVCKRDYLRGWNKIQPKVKHSLFPDKSSFPQFEFHENFLAKLPEGANVLASSDHDVHEVFMIGPRIFATAYHPEVSYNDALRIYKETGLTPEEQHQEIFGDPGSEAQEASRTFFEALTTFDLPVFGV